MAQHFEIIIRRMTSFPRRDNALADADTIADIVKAVRGKDILEFIAPVSEAQLIGLTEYIRLMALEGNTSTVETALTALF